MTETLINIGGVDHKADAMNLPTDRANRDAWVVGADGKTIEVDDARVKQLAEEEADQKEASIFETDPGLKALANATADMLVALRDGELDGLTQAEVRKKLRQTTRRKIRKEMKLS